MVLIRETKIEQLTNLLNIYDVNMQAALELGINWGWLKSSESFVSFFDAEVKLKSSTGHNSNENPVSNHQQGGTGLLAVNEIIPYCKKAGNDFRHLGRWSWYTLQGDSTHRTRVITAYNTMLEKPNPRAGAVSTSSITGTTSFMTFR